jgi:hypothetical protein
MTRWEGLQHVEQTKEYERRDDASNARRCCSEREEDAADFVDDDNLRIVYVFMPGDNACGPYSDDTSDECGAKHAEDAVRTHGVVERQRSE